MVGSLVQSVIDIKRMARNRLLNLIDPPVVVLIYHRVTTLPSDPQMLAVTPENFRQHLRYLKDNFPVVRFESDWKDIKEPAVAITFDDGYADNAVEALPVLEEVGVPATFFVSTGNIGTRAEFWWDELERTILGAHDFPDSFSLEDSRFGRTWSTASTADRETLYRDIHPLVKQLAPLSRESWLQQLRHWAQTSDVGREPCRAMTVDELRRLAQSSWVTIGAHTVSHTMLSALSVAEQREEIFRSRSQLESWLQRDIEVFSYPFGWQTDYTSESIELCKEADFVKVAACFQGQAHRWTDPFQVPRQLVRNWPLEQFVKEMRTFWVT